MKRRATIEYTDAELPELQRLEAEGKITILEESQLPDESQADEPPMYVPKRVGFINRERDIIPGKKLDRPLREIIGGISKEDAEYLIRRIEEGWE